MQNTPDNSFQPWTEREVVVYKRGGGKPELVPAKALLKPLWDARPLESGSWGNIEGFNDGLGGGDFIDMRHWRLPTPRPLANEPPMYRPAHGLLPPSYQSGGVRRCYIPTAEDVAAVGALYPAHSNPYAPPWQRIEADLILAGHKRGELVELNPPALIGLLQEARRPRPLGAPPGNTETLCEPRRSLEEIQLVNYLTELRSEAEAHAIQTAATARAAFGWTEKLHEEPNAAQALAWRAQLDALLPRLRMLCAPPAFAELQNAAARGDYRETAEILDEIKEAALNRGRIQNGRPSTEGQPTPFAMDEAAAKLSDAERLARIPPFDKKSKDWVSNKEAKRLEKKGKDTLCRYRKKGIVAPDGSCGIDPYGREWRRIGTARSHPWYYVPSLKSPQPIK